MGGTIMGVPRVRIIVYWGLYGDTLILGNHHIVLPQTRSQDTKADFRDGEVAFAHATLAFGQRVRRAKGFMLS